MEYDTREYYSFHGYSLRDGMRAAIGAELSQVQNHSTIAAHAATETRSTTGAAPSLAATNVTGGADHKLQTKVGLIRRHWRGGLTLPQSYWGMYVLLNFLLVGLGHGLASALRSFNLLSPIVLGITLVLFVTRVAEAGLHRRRAPPLLAGDEDTLEGFRFLLCEVVHTDMLPGLKAEGSKLRHVLPPLGASSCRPFARFA
jgi:hypothetical protein